MNARDAFRTAAGLSMSNETPGAKQPSRQLAYRRRQLAKGLCPMCGHLPLGTRT